MSASVAAVEVHRTILAQANSSNLRFKSSNVSGKVSTHTTNDSITFSSIFAFQKIVSNAGHARRSLMASINGSIVVSVNTAYNAASDTETAPKSKKRKLDTGIEEAKRAVEKVRRCGKDASRVSDESYESAASLISDLLKLRGPHGESVVESWAISLRKNTQWAGANSPGEAPRLVVAARIAAGVAVSMEALTSAIRVCKDGLLTVAEDTVDEDFNLPLSEQATCAQQAGQKTIILLASVPSQFA